jgi:hypothetical protein
VISGDQERRIRQRINRAFADDADKYESDKHSALEDVLDILNEGR